MNLICYFIYVAEMVVKLLGMGFLYYFSDKFNIFDSIVVAISTTDFIFLFVSSTSVDIKAFNALRAVRILRVIKMVKSWS